MSGPEQAVALRAEGLSYAAIAARLGVSGSTILRWLNPDIAEKTRVQSREAKRRRTGACVDCGTVTRYNGRPGTPVSERCPACAAIHVGQQQTIWTQDRIIDAIRTWADEHDGEPPAIPDWSPNQARRLGDDQRATRFENDPRFPWFSVVIYAFGSWNNAIRAAGFEPRPSHGTAASYRRRRAVAA